MTIELWLAQASTQFAEAGIASARLDAELLLRHVFEKDKTWLIAHGKQPLTVQQMALLHRLHRRRLHREPMAYLLGSKEFYGRNFAVNQSVLVPRPETEALIETLADLQPKPGDHLVDVGTGSGIIAITAKLEWPKLEVTALDISPGALATAKGNAAQLGANVSFIQSNLLAQAPAESYQFVVANLPYVDPAWPVSTELEYEPPVALFAEDGGLAAVRRLLPQALANLTPGGHLLLEIDPRQHEVIGKEAEALGFTSLRSQGFMLHLQMPGA